MNIKKSIRLRIGKLSQFLRRCEDEYSLFEARRKSGCNFFFVNQGTGGLTVGNAQNLQMDATSHFKSGACIECQGGVRIGRYFHTGRGLTIFSSNHKYNGGHSIPYDDESELKPVIIEDFVWCGANVTIMPGVTIGEGAVIGGGSVVAKDIPKYAVAVGNPAKIVKYRDIEQFESLKAQGKFT